MNDSFIRIAEINTPDWHYRESMSAFWKLPCCFKLDAKDYYGPEAVIGM